MLRHLCMTADYEKKFLVSTKPFQNTKAALARHLSDNNYIATMHTFVPCTHWGFGAYNYCSFQHELRVPEGLSHYIAEGKLLRNQ